MDNIISALLKDPIINRLASGPPSTRSSALPETLIARVASFKGETALLRWQGGTFSASLDANVSAGETLLLQYKGQLKSRPHYRIISRMAAPLNSGELLIRDTGEPALFGVLPSTDNTKGAGPALIRFNPEKRGTPDQSASTEPFLELYLDTDSFGLVLIKFYFHETDRLECRFIVETPEAGLALQEEASRLIKEAGGTDGKIKGKPLNVSVSNLQKSAAEALYSGGRGLNVKA